jgi:hypothetical protein
MLQRFVLIVENRSRARKTSRWSTWRLEDELTAGPTKRQALAQLKEEQAHDQKHNNDFFQVRTRLFELVEVRP